MLSLERCRELLGPEVQLSDEELARLVEQMRALAGVTVSMFLDSKRGGTVKP